MVSDGTRISQSTGLKNLINCLGSDTMVKSKKKATEKETLKLLETRMKILENSYSTLRAFAMDLEQRIKNVQR